jgi:hypothetical protein
LCSRSFRREGSYPKNSHETVITQFQATAFALPSLFLPVYLFCQHLLSSPEKLAFNGDNNAHHKVKSEKKLKEKDLFYGTVERL